MKIRHLFLVVIMALTTVATAVAQAPLSFTYQAVVRNSSGRLVSNATVGVKISIVRDSAIGQVVYSGVQTPRTNANGLFTLVIGDSQNGIDTITWRNGPYFLKSEVDPNGGSNYTLTSVQQMLSVPYALHAHTVDNVIGGVNFIERQVLSMNGDTVFLTGGSYVVLPPSFSGDYNDLTNKPTIPTNVSAFYNDAGYLTSATLTETQVLSIRHDTVFLTGGSFVKLPAGFSGNYNDLTNKPTNVSSFNNDAGYLTNATLTEHQNLSDVATINDSVNSQIKNLYNPTDSMDAVNLRTLNAVVSRYDSIINSLIRYIDTIREPTNNILNDKSFSVSVNKHVYFSPGNLQWSATGGGSTATTHVVAGGSTAAGTWRFAEHQWDYIGAANSNISSSYTGWIDLFGWGTSGYHDPTDQYNTNYYPYSSSTTTVNTTFNNYGYGPSLDTNMPTPDIAGSNYDWGVFNAIFNPTTHTTDAPGTWRTLTRDEWRYLLNTRSTVSGMRYVKAIVNGVRGLIIVPDNWNNSTYHLISTNDNSNNLAFFSNCISSTNWITLENAGCIFLPAMGSRQGTSFYFNSNQEEGRYWAATSNYLAADVLSINYQAVSVGSYARSIGYFVRLVRDVE